MFAVRHAEIARDVGDRRLAVAVVTEEPLGGIENARHVLLTRRIDADVKKTAHGKHSE